MICDGCPDPLKFDYILDGCFCLAKYWFDGAVCNLNPENCYYANSQDGACTKAEYGYYLFDLGAVFECQAGIPGCDDC